MRQFIRLKAIIFVLFCGLQATLAADEKWRPVTPEELAMTAGKVDPNADAEAIFWEVRVDDAPLDDLAINYYVRIKILSERGREKFAKLDLEYFAGGSKIKEFAVRVILANGTVVNVPEDNVFDREILRGYYQSRRARSLAIPKNEVGAIIEYRYKEVLENSGSAGMPLDLQHHIPIQNLRYYLRRYDRKEPRFNVFNTDNVSFVKDRRDFYLLERNNVPAFEEEPQMPPIRSVRPWIKLHYVPGLLFYPEIRESKDPRVYWDVFASRELTQYSAAFKTEKEIVRLVGEITAGATSDEEKVARIYKYCQSNIKNLDFSETSDEERSAARQVSTPTVVLKRRFGTAAQIDVTFASMVKAAGFNPAITYLSDRSRILFDPDTMDSSMVAPGAIAIQLRPEQWEYYNPGIPVLPPGDLLWFEQDVFALLIEPRFSRWIKTSIGGADDSLSKRTGRFRLKEDGSIEGEVKMEFSGQEALVRRLDLYRKNEERRVEIVSSEVKSLVPQAEISTVSVENVTDYTKPLTYAYRISIPGFADRTGRRLFVRPSVFQFGVPPRFTSSQRKHRIYFAYPFSEQDDIQITWPEGFAVDSVEKAKDVADPSGITSLKTRISADENERALTFRRDFFFGGGPKPSYLFDVKNYGALKNLFDMFYRADNHTISLKAM